MRWHKCKQWIKNTIIFSAWLQREWSVHPIFTLCFRVRVLAVITCICAFESMMVCLQVCTVVCINQSWSSVSMRVPLYVSASLGWLGFTTHRCSAPGCLFWPSCMEVQHSPLLYGPGPSSYLGSFYPTADEDIVAIYLFSPWQWFVQKDILESGCTRMVVGSTPCRPNLRGIC